MTDQAPSTAKPAAKGWSRRRVIALSAATLALIGAGVGAYQMSRFSSLEGKARELAFAISKRVSSLRLDASDELVTRWVGDQQSFGGSLKLKKGRATRTQVERFLLSTDLCAQGRDEDSPLSYVAYYDPRKTPCYNPLRRD